jgi:hypothetical protein
MEQLSDVYGNIPRKDWGANDPNLIAEGLFAVANIFSALKSPPGVQPPPQAGSTPNIPGAHGVGYHSLWRHSALSGLGLCLRHQPAVLVLLGGAESHVLQLPEPN